MKLGALQMNSGADPQANLDAIRAGCEQAGAAGVDLLLLPENALLMGRTERDKLAVAEDFGNGPMQADLAGMARQAGLHLVAGSFPLRVADDPERVWSSALVYAPDGECVARYDKLHLFDVQAPDGQVYAESRRFRAGENTPQCFDCQGVSVGLSICYDLRFPELYRALTAQGAELLLVPAAFTHATGQAHWDILLRARAVENLAGVLAANQCGTHPNGWRTWGHSLIADAWGAILAQADEQPGLITATMDLAAQRRRREEFPVLRHRRL